MKLNQYTIRVFSGASLLRFMFSCKLWGRRDCLFRKHDDSLQVVI